REEVLLARLHGTRLVAEDAIQPVRPRDALALQIPHPCAEPDDGLDRREKRVFVVLRTEFPELFVGRAAATGFHDPSWLQRSTRPTSARLRTTRANAVLWPSRHTFRKSPWRTQRGRVRATSPSTHS